MRKWSNMLDVRDSSFLPNSNVYVLLPATYGTLLGYEGYRYYRVTQYVEGDDNATCTVLEDGLTIPGKCIQVPISVVKENVVKKGETLSKVGELMFQFCALKSDKHVNIGYGQIVKVSWEQNTVFESIDARAYVYVQTKYKVLKIPKMDIVVCSELNYALQPFSTRYADTFDRVKIQAVHRVIDDSVVLATPMVFVETLVTLDKNMQHIRWMREYAIFNAWGKPESIVIEETINTRRMDVGLPLWTQLDTKALKIEKQVQNRLRRANEDTSNSLSSTFTECFEKIKLTIPSFNNPVDNAIACDESTNHKNSPKTPPCSAKTYDGCNLIRSPKMPVHNVGKTIIF